MQDVNPRVSVTCQRNITEDGLCIECEARDPEEGGVWGESKLAKMVRSGSLTPRFVNNDCVATEIVYSTAHACYKVLAWSQDDLCFIDIRPPPRKRRYYCCITAEPVGSGTRGKRLCCVRLYCGCCCVCCVRASRKAVLRLPCQPGKNKHACSSYSSSSLLPTSQLTPCLLWVQ